MAEGDPVTRIECADIHDREAHRQREHHDELIHRLDRLDTRMDQAAKGREGLQRSVSKAEFAARTAAVEALHAAEQASETNGRVRIIEIWKAKVEGAGMALNVGWGLLFGSGALLAVAGIVLAVALR